MNAPAPEVKLLVNCPRCGFEILKDAGDRRVIGRVKVFFIENSVLTCRCKICGHDTNVKLA